MLKIKINSKVASENISKSLEKELQKKFENTAKTLVKTLEEKTPKDTGLAASSWKLDLKNSKATITNEQDYVKYLNSGSSKQAPSHYIESTTLRYGKPKGQIVTYK